MKPKKLSEKLGLNKKTVAHLTAKGMNDVKGGATNNSIYPCPVSSPQIICTSEQVEQTCGTCYDTCVC